MTLTSCIDCGAPTERTRCEDCRPAHRKITRPAQPRDYKVSARKRGYDSAWDRLSRRARELQPWCFDCGATEDLQGDHSAEAWERKATGSPLRLRDIEVVCGPCNRARGAQRGTQAPRGATPEGRDSDPVPFEAMFPSYPRGYTPGEVV